MHDDTALLEARLKRFVRDRLEPALYRDAVPLEVAAWHAPGEPVPFDEAAGQAFEAFPIGKRWGAPWSTTWFRVTGDVPAAWRAGAPDGTRIEVVVDFGYNRAQPGFQAEALAYRPDGTPVKSVHPRNSYVPWRPERDGARVELLLEAAANPNVAGGYTFAPTPFGSRETAPTAPLYKLTRLDLALLDVAVWELLQDVIALRGLAQELPAESQRRHEILRALEDALDAIDPENVAGTAADGRAALAPALSRPASASAHKILATGHAHIDSAWLWPLRETVRKCARTFTNVMALMDEHPDLVFACSSAQQYLWMKEHHPRVFARIRQKVAEGRFVPVGGMWVESDTNMPGSEAMARQFVAGKRFFLEEFGVECEETWLPDSFGYSAGLPQIARAAGNRWFLTQKISWNQTNRMPHHTFRWEGIDGSRVFTHFPPADTYNSDLSAADLARAERQFAEKGRATRSLVPFGWGDGGGGPTREMVAQAHRTADLEGSPVVEIGSPRTFFAEAEAEYPDAPVWSGEMYLELHRGVLTSQARTKQGNRRNEGLLREAELWATTAAVRAGLPYPTAELQEAWHTVLLLQFHDILPGSSIAWVHREAERRHDEVTAQLQRIIDRSLAALAGDGDTAISVNASPFARDGIAAFGGGTAAITHPPVTVAAASGGEPGGDVLDNGVVRVIVDAGGRIASLRSHTDGREAIPADSPAAALRLHRDLPNLWDAWDLDPHYARTVTELDEADERRVEHDDDGGVTVVTIRRLGLDRPQPTVIQQRVTLRPGADAVEVSFVIDWHEREKILKLAVPLDVHADRIAAETQFGHLFRATHVNTSWDAARFEACQHRFAYLGEPGYGVAIANDSTYGYDVGRSTRPDGGTTTTVRFSLLRAPLFPDPEADQGRHHLTFRLRPGSSIGDAVRLGYQLQSPPREVTGVADIRPLVASSNPAVVVETVKPAEDGSGDLVVRLYESLGGRAATRLTLDAPATGATLTDLLERDLEVQDGDTSPACERAQRDETTTELELTFRPFQLRTVRFSGVGVA